jgi:hypothetical protein
MVMKRWETLDKKVQAKLTKHLNEVKTVLTNENIEAVVLTDGTTLKRT